MTIDEYIAKLGRVANNVQGIELAVFLSAKSAQALAVERIFEKGLDVNNAKIGSYNNTNEVYVSDPTPVGATHLGKPNLEGKQKTTKTSYYESYKAFRSQQTRETGFVNLRLFGRLQIDFSNAPVKLSESTYGIKVSQESYNKIKGNEKRFNKSIFKHTKEERDAFYRSIKFEIKKLILQA